MSAPALAPAPARHRRVRIPVLDEAATHMLHLPPARSEYKLTRGIAIPASDGIMLAADLYQPVRKASGTLLVRGPYGRGMPFSLLTARIFAVYGYNVLLVSSRGTFGSGGEFDPARTEAADGQDVVAWPVRQSWFTGSFATLGGSYLGYTQWALLADPPAELVTAIITVGPHDLSRHTWGTGAFNLDLLGWSDMIAHQEDGGALSGLFRRAIAARRLRPVLDGLPLADVAEKHLDDRPAAAAWYRERATRPDLTDPFWAPMQHGGALGTVSIPVLLQSGWQDLFLSQTIEQYTRLHERGVEVALTVGPWTHLETISKGASLLTKESLDWLDAHLADAAGSRRRSPVRVFVTGAGAWRDLDAWPPATTPSVWYPRRGGGLDQEAPPADAVPSTFTFDPARPTPTVGGPLLEGGGIVNDSRLAQRDDVLTFTSSALAAPLEVMGAPVLELAHHSDNPHADLFVRLSEMDAKGRSRNVTEGYVRLNPARGDGPIRLKLRPAAHRFAAGSRLRLYIAGGSHPQFARNLGTGENPGSGAGLRPASHTIAHAGETASSLTLPTSPP
jgi:uncharacterized protein